MSKQISVGLIKPSPYQPRLTFDLEDIRGSVEKDGILVALTVREKDGYFELVDGERRLRLAKDLGYETVKCDVIDVSDEVARRMVWKVNTLRKDYTPQEKAYHFKKLQKMGMSFRGIARECDYGEQQVVAHLNVLRLPDKYQTLVWDGPLTVSHIQELRPFFNTNASNEALAEKLNLILERKLTVPELRRVIKPELEEIERKRVESAKKAVGKITTEVKEPESPEELEKAAQTLKREAKKKRESQLSEEEKAKRKAEKQRKKEEQKRKREEKKRKEGEIRKKREDEIRKQAEQEAKNKLLQDKGFIEEAAKLAPTLNEEVKESNLPFENAPQKTDQIVKEMVKELVPTIKAAFANIPPENPHDPERNKLVLNMILKNLQQGLVFCPICDQRMLECSYCHTSLEKMKEEQKL